MSSSSATDRSVFSDLEVGDRVRFVITYGVTPPDRNEQEGQIVETDLEHPIYNWAFRQYRVKTGDGTVRVPANDIEEVL